MAYEDINVPAALPASPGRTDVQPALDTIHALLQAIETAVEDLDTRVQAFEE